MKNFHYSLATAVVILFQVSCGTSLKVTSDYDKQANFQQYKTFSIDTLNINQRISHVNTARIINAVKAELFKKGFTENTSNPDLKVSVAVIFKDENAAAPAEDYYGYGGIYRPWAWGSSLGATGHTTYNIQKFENGSVIIGLADAKTNSLVWEGIGNREIDKPLKSPDTSIPAAIASIMKNFPPVAGK